MGYSLGPKHCTLAFFAFLVCLPLLILVLRHLRIPKVTGTDTFGIGRLHHKDLVIINITEIRCLFAMGVICDGDQSRFVALRATTHVSLLRRIVGHLRGSLQSGFIAILFL